jgi:hypothetical protein
MRILAVILLLIAALSPAAATFARGNTADRCAQAMAMPAAKMMRVKSAPGPMVAISCVDCCTTVVQPVAVLKIRDATTAPYEPSAVVVLTSFACNLDPPLPRIAGERPDGFTIL